ncbi:sugar ABC transporter permease [Paenibacillus alba]|uniref:carbohydrate ABC transporter permease n=1 Tax=Paenibacillus alba TaxID=1197127 RepID=UPI00156349B7|nr:sugar ABC transporter permease [Paenibacillus alba]NQX66976.1 sugar ABC transporter permease [Paenibacillus alba]
MNSRLYAERKQTGSLLLFIGPFLIVFAVFFLYPLARGVVLSFTDWNGIERTAAFNGIQNYVELFTDDNRFLHSLWITFIFTACTVVISNFVSLLLAVVIESGTKFKNTLRTLFFLPYIFSLVVVGFTWKIMYIEIVPDIAKLSKLLQFLNLDYIGNPYLALYSVIIMNIWFGIGYYLIIYLAGIQTIDSSVMEAASIDGAVGWRRFSSITVPLLMPSISICVFTSITGSLKIFDAIFVLTGGGPGYSTESIALNIYYEAFGTANRFGYGMAKSVVLGAVILIISYFQLKFFSSREVEA